MLSQEIRRRFLEYFKNHQHTVVASSPVIPHDDPTLLFINAGMNQFKDVFLGKSKREYTRATTSQKCVRVGGKHNDLDNVGHTSRHLTFFEMLGNFSFGDYFKKEAIKFSWEVATEVFGFTPERIWPTVYLDDDEAFELWKQYVPEARITRFGEEENYWSMGEVGPCGPCSELLFDRGEKYGNAANPHEDPSGERYLEFWNLVFMQFNRHADGTKDPLPSPSIDTGAGLERVVGLKLGVDSVFETDILRELIAEVEQISKKPYRGIHDHAAPAFHVISDHLRSLAFAIADGVQPSNVDRGYVLRKVLRRAVRYGRQLGMERPFLAQVLPKLVKTMGSDYPELIASQGRIEEILTTEEEAFLRTLKRGGTLLADIVRDAKDKDQCISGDQAFKLKDTYGFPLEEILLIAKDEELSLDIKRYESLEKKARELSKKGRKSTEQVAETNLFAKYVEENGETLFTGYDELTTKTTVKSFVVDGDFVDSIHANQKGMVILESSPFYSEKGGQIGDQGNIYSDQGHFVVEDTQSPYPGVTIHTGQLTEGILHVGDQVEAEVDSTRRQKIANNHTATHLLHFALQQVLGEHVKQAGSIVDQSRLRFDFSHHKSLTEGELKEIEAMVNEHIRSNCSVENYELSYEEAQGRQDIKQFFGDKYGARVRVIDIGPSKELCGGTHTSATGNIGYFRISKESSIAAGVRRIEAVTGVEAEAFVREKEDLLDSAATLLKTRPHQLMERLEKTQEEIKLLNKQLQALQNQQRQNLLNRLDEQVKKSGDISYASLRLTLPIKELRSFAEEALSRIGSGVVVVGAAEGERCGLLAVVSEDIASRGYEASHLIKVLAPKIGGSGGGKKHLAQAGGKEPNNLDQALAAVSSVIAAVAQKI